MVADNCRQGYLDALKFLERRGRWRSPQWLGTSSHASAKQTLLLGPVRFYGPWLTHARPQHLLYVRPELDAGDQRGPRPCVLLLSRPQPGTGVRPREGHRPRDAQGYGSPEQAPDPAGELGRRRVEWSRKASWRQCLVRKTVEKEKLKRALEAEGRKARAKEQRPAPSENVTQYGCRCACVCVRVHARACVHA